MSTEVEGIFISLYVYLLYIKNYSTYSTFFAKTQIK